MIQEKNSGILTSLSMKVATVKSMADQLQMFTTDE